MTGLPSLRPQDFKGFLDGFFTGDASEARAFCERTMSPNFIRFAAGADRTDFERGVEKIAFFRANASTWRSSIKFFSQDGNKIAARLIVELAIGDEPAKTLEMMFMAELDGQGRYEYVWEQVSPYEGQEGI